jgi:hypothetical protein
MYEKSAAKIKEKMHNKKWARTQKKCFFLSDRWWAAKKLKVKF